MVNCVVVVRLQYSEASVVDGVVTEDASVCYGDADGVYGAVMEGATLCYE